MWEGVVPNCCSPVLLTEHKDQQFFSYVMVKFRYVVISAGVLKLLNSGHRHRECQENTSVSK